ncbi:hypothetical protein MPER_09732, partial [Moniliophthora perniciosa FA553]
MFSEGFSSPPALNLSLPPSSAPDALDLRSENGDATSNRGGTPRRPTADALTLGDEDMVDSQQTASSRRRRKVQGQMNGDVPLVRDPIGESVTETFESFLKSFTEDVALASTPRSDGGILDMPEGDLFYVEQIHQMRENELTTLYIDFGHILAKDEDLANAITQQYYRFLPYLRRGLLNVVTEVEPEYLKVNPTAATTDSSNLQSREFYIAFYHLPLVHGIRSLRTDHIGTLLSISGTVTPSFVKFAMALVHDIEQQFKFTEPSLCPNPTCGNRTAWQLQIDTSKFTDWQKVRIQENPSEIPTGSMPRSLDVILRSELVERAKAGDKFTFTGTFIVVPDVSQLGLPGGNQSQLQREANRGANGAAGGIAGGVTGLKSLGVRDLQYKMHSDSWSKITNRN